MNKHEWVNMNVRAELNGYTVALRLWEWVKTEEDVAMWKREKEKEGVNKRKDKDSNRERQWKREKAGGLRNGEKEWDNRR